MSSIYGRLYTPSTDESGIEENQKETGERCKSVRTEINPKKLNNWYWVKPDSQQTKICK